MGVGVRDIQYFRRQPQMFRDGANPGERERERDCGPDGEGGGWGVRGWGCSEDVQGRGQPG